MYGGYAPAERVRKLPGHYFDEVERRIAAATSGEATRTASVPLPVINVARGNPDLPTPPHIVRALQQAAERPSNHRYPPVEGTAQVRQAIADRYHADHGVELDPDREIAVFHGAHEALMAALHALLNPGDVLRIADPFYPLYLSGAALAGARVETVPVSESRGFLPDFASVATTSWQSTRLLLLNYPNNPTGALADEATFDTALTLAAENGFPLINDFAYSSLGFDGRRPLSVLTIDTEKRHSIEVSTLSKTYSMAGWRFGYAVGNASLVRALASYQAVAYSTIFGAVQEAATAALTGDQSCVGDLVAEYECRRDLVVAGLRELGWDVAAPAGTFFVWLRVPASVAQRAGGPLDGEAFADLLLRRAGVAVAPGAGFGEGGRDYVRISLVLEPEQLSLMLERLRALAATHT